MGASRRSPTSALFLLLALVLSLALASELDPSLHGMTEELLPFDIAVKSFDWPHYAKYQDAHSRLTTEMLFNVTSFLVPYMDATSRAKGVAPVIPPPHVDVDCQAMAKQYNPGVFTGQPLTVKPRIFDFVPVAHELDLLELRLYELNDTVDYFVILEGTHTHRGQRKHLFFSRHFERFLPFRKKIVHIVADDGAQLKYETETQAAGDVWDIEHQMRVSMYRKFVQAVGEPNPNDLLIHGDCDEIPARSAMLMFKHCELASDALPITFTGPFFRWNVNHLAPSPHTELNYPNLFSKKQLVEKGGEVALYRGPARTIGHRTAVHFNRFSGSIVDLMYKEAAMAEGGKIAFSYFEEGLARIIQDIGQTRQFWAQYSTADDLLNLPWMLICFPERYPYIWWSTTEAQAVINQIKKKQPVSLPDTFSVASKFPCPNRAKYAPKAPPRPPPPPPPPLQNVVNPDTQEAENEQPQAKQNTKVPLGRKPLPPQIPPPKPKPPTTKPKPPKVNRPKTPLDTGNTGDIVIDSGGEEPFSSSIFEGAYFLVLVAGVLFVFIVVLGRRGICRR